MGGDGPSRGRVRKTKVGQALLAYNESLSQRCRPAARSAADDLEDRQTAPAIFRSALDSKPSFEVLDRPVLFTSHAPHPAIKPCLIAPQSRMPIIHRTKQFKGEFCQKNPPAMAVWRHHFEPDSVRWVIVLPLQASAQFSARRAHRGKAQSPKMALTVLK